MLSAVLVVLASYLIGSISAAYVAGRLLGGVDIRQVGSHNVGASNVWQTVSRAAVVPVGLADIAQTMLCIGIAKWTGQPLGIQVLAGLAALIGHNWSPYLGLTGGRGVGPAIGFMLVLSWPGLGVFCGVSLIGVALRAVPQCVGLGIAVAPFAALGNGQSPEIVAGLVAVAALVLAKRLLTNQPGIPTGAEPRQVLLNRLLYDRDTRERESWVQRGPRQAGR
jgi:glycerol-3-phosphate acyltransferase PlsY